MKGHDRKERASMRDMFTGAFAICRNPSAHQEVQFAEPREVVDMICFANQLLRRQDHAIRSTGPQTWTQTSQN
jgi:hypothetical protein